MICRRHDCPVLNSSINDLVWLISVSFEMTIHWIWHSSRRAQLTRSRQSFRFGTQYTIKHMLRHSYECCVYMCLSPAKSLRLATAYTSYGAADKLIRRLTAYEVCGGLWRLTEAAGGSSWVGNGSTLCWVWNGRSAKKTCRIYVYLCIEYRQANPFIRCGSRTGLIWLLW